MKVLMLSPGFPEDMPYFTRGLAAVGAQVLGVGDQPLQAVPETAREALSGYIQVPSLWKEDELIERLRKELRGQTLDRVECLWEPGMTVAARLREEFDVPGLRVEQTVPLRDKEAMKATLDAAGLRTPHHYRAQSTHEVSEAVERIGYPVIVKPIDGAGSADTYRLDGADDLKAALEAIRHVPEVIVEEFIEGEELTFDTVSIQGKPAYENIAWYRPKPLVTRLNPWVSQVVVCLRDVGRPEVRAGRELGWKVIETLGLETGFTHMEWFLTPSGEAVFGEIGGRAPGGRLTHVMNYSSDVDLFTGWAEAVCHGRFTQKVDRRYNAAAVFKRATGGGQTITAVDGLDSLLARYGEHVVHIDLNTVGKPRRDWRKIVTGDGWLIVRHPDFDTTLEIADHFANELRVEAA